MYPFEYSVDTKTELLYLVEFSINFGNQANKRKGQDRHHSELPGNSEHKDEESCRLNEAPQEDVDVLGDEVTHLRGVS